MTNLGMIFALFGTALAVVLSGLGSSKGVGLASEAAGGVLIDDPSKFGKLLVLQLLPGTQGLYGLIVGVIVLMNVGILGGNAMVLDASVGLQYLMACLPIAFGGYFSARAQGRVCAVGVNLIAKRPEESSKAIVSASLIELYALLGFIVSFLMVIGIKA